MALAVVEGTEVWLVRFATSGEDGTGTPWAVGLATSQTHHRDHSMRPDV